MRSKLVCGLYNIHDIDEINLKVKNEIHRMSKKYLYHLENRYSADSTFEINKYETIDRLQTYYDILKSVKERTLAGNSTCLDRESLQLLMEKIIRIVGKNCIIECQDYKIDSSREEEWVVKSPFCRTYEDWEKWAKIICGKLNLSISSETETLSNLILEVSREIITPNVLLAISAYKEAKGNINLKINRTDEEIKLDFKLLIEKVPDCDLTLDLYTKLVKDHKASYDIIETICKEGLTLEAPNDNIELKTPMHSYDLNKFSGNIKPEYLEKFGMKATINKKDLLQDYK